MVATKDTYITTPYIPGLYSISQVTTDFTTSVFRGSASEAENCRAELSKDSKAEATTIRQSAVRVDLYNGLTGKRDALQLEDGYRIAKNEEMTPPKFKDELTRVNLTASSCTMVRDFVMFHRVVRQILKVEGAERFVKVFSESSDEEAPFRAVSYSGSDVKVFDAFLDVKLATERKVEVACPFFRVSAKVAALSDPFFLRRVMLGSAHALRASVDIPSEEWWVAQEIQRENAAGLMEEIVDAVDTDWQWGRKSSDFGEALIIGCPVKLARVAHLLGIP